MFSQKNDRNVLKFSSLKTIDVNISIGSWTKNVSEELEKHTTILKFTDKNWFYETWSANINDVERFKS